MIRITDMTLSCLDQYSPSRKQLTDFLRLLLELGVDVIEISSHVLNILDDLPPGGKYLVRVKHPEETSLFPGYGRFLCRKSYCTTSSHITQEIRANDIRDINFISQYGPLENVRITGFDTILTFDYVAVFQHLKSQVSGRLEFCPENSSYCATAIAVEWLLNGGTDVVTAFGGMNDKASTEEVLLALYLFKKTARALNFSVLPELRQMFTEMTRKEIPKKKAVIGSEIFDVESGIHVDGILKNPQMYEPFSPELVGNKRKVVLGKHSGKKAVALKLSEVGLSAENYDISGILEAVKELSAKKNERIENEELLKIAECYPKNRDLAHTLSLTDRDLTEKRSCN